MDTWLNKNPDFEYIRWTEAEFANREIVFEAQERIDLINEYCGKTDIMRLEILYRYGGIFIDADSICIEPIGDLFERFSDKSGFATYENENSRKGLVANGNLAIIPKHPLIRDMLDWILSEASIIPIKSLRSWASVGPVLLTNTLKKNNYPEFMVLPSYYFLPIHFTGVEYTSHGKVYAHQLWGSNYDLYNKEIISYEINNKLLYPSSKINICIDLNPIHLCSDHLYILFKSIKLQRGYFAMDIYFILGDSFSENSIFWDFLQKFERKSRFIKTYILSKSDFLSSKIKSYINISDYCILHSDTIEKIIGGNIESVPCYLLNNLGKPVIRNESFIIKQIHL